MLRESRMRSEYQEFFRDILPTAMRTGQSTATKLDAVMSWVTSLAPMPTLSNPADQVLLHRLFLDDDQGEVCSNNIMHV